MKLLHLSDLHLGKRVYEYSMLEDQRHVLDQILHIVDTERPDGVLIAGDIYDKSVPSAEAVALCDSFLVALAQRKTPVFLIAGNHDSPERLAFGGRLMDASGIHISPVYNGVCSCFTLQDEQGPVDIFLLPFVKPATVRRFFPECEIQSYTDAVKAALSNAPLTEGRRSVLVAHQFVTGSARCESEELSVGGTDNVDVSAFDGFDYVALGHLHGSQNAGAAHIRYCGTPLKYSLSEVHHAKSVSLVVIDITGTVKVDTIPLRPLHEMVELRGSYEQVASAAFYGGTTWQEDYVRITLTDEDDIPDAAGKLRTIYHNLLRLDYDNKRTRSQGVIEADVDVQTKTPMDLFSDFYALQNGQPLSREQTLLVEEMIDQIWEGVQ